MPAPRSSCPQMTLYSEKSSTVCLAHRARDMSRFSVRARFSSRCRALRAQALDGAAAARQLASRVRRQRHPPRRRVAAALSGREHPHLVLTVRSEHVRHSGQVSLPGGVVEPGETLRGGRAARGARGNRLRLRHDAGARPPDADRHPRQRVPSSPHRRGRGPSTGPPSVGSRSGAHPRGCRATRCSIRARCAGGR